MADSGKTLATVIGEKIAALRPRLFNISSGNETAHFAPRMSKAAETILIEKMDALAVLIKAQQALE